MQEPLLFEIKNNIGFLTLNQPELLNRLSVKLMESLNETTKKISQDKSLRALVIQGAGKAFCTGGDLNQFASMQDRPVEEIKSMVNHGLLSLESAIKTIHLLPIPVLAAVHGAARGAGISLMLAADLVLAEEGTRFSLSYTHVGLTPDGASTYFLPRAVGLKKAMEMLMLSDEFSTTDALHFGIINWSCPSENFSDKKLEIATRLATGPTAAYRRLKQLVYASQHNNLNDQLAAEGEMFMQSFLSDDFRAGLQAFALKQKPHFTGK